MPEYQRDSLIQLARDARQKGWRHAYGDTVQPHLTAYLGLGLQGHPDARPAADRRLRARCSARPGSGPGIPGTEPSVGLLMERQRQATATPHRLWVVLDEAALRHQVGGREVMREQIEHLLELSTHPGVSIQVMPYSSGLHIAMDVPFTIMSFPDPADPTWSAIPHRPAGDRGRDGCSRYTTLFHHLQAAALPLPDSAELMTSVLKELQPG